MGGVVDFGEKLIKDVGGVVVDKVLTPAWELATGPFVMLYDMIIPEEDIPGAPAIPDRIGNTMSEGVFVSRTYGTCKIGGNKIRFNAATDTDLRVIIGHCMGPVSGVSRYEVNDLEWSTLTGSHSKTEYTGTRTQTADGRFSSDASAYRSIAYTAFTFAKNDQQVGYNPNVTVTMDGMLCAPLAGGASAFTRNPAVILYDWLINVEGYSAGDLDLNAFKSLEALCDAVPSGSSLPRYRFDYSFDSGISINDAKKLIWSSFNGFSIMSHGKFKPVWDSAQMADGSGGLTAKTSSHAFTLDNIVKDSFKWKQLERPNLVRIDFLDSEKQYKSSSVEVMDESDINENGEILYNEKAPYITNIELARRRAKFKFNKKRYPDYSCEFSALSGAGDIEVLDLVTITHILPGWTSKQFLITSRSEDATGKMKFTAEAYYPGAYDDSQAGTQANFESTLPNPHQPPPAATGVTSAMTAYGSAFDFDAVKISLTPPADDPFYSHTIVYASSDDAAYYEVGTTDGGNDFIFSALGTVYEPGETCYIKLRSVNEKGVIQAMPGSADTSVSVTSTMRLGSFYAGTNFFGDNAVADNASILLDKTNSLMRLGAVASTYITVDGPNVRVRSSNYVSGAMGSGFTLEPELLEVGNIACRGEFRTNVFQKNTVSAVGGNLLVVSGDVLAEDITATDGDELDRSTEAGDTRITEAGDTRTTEGVTKQIVTKGNETFSIGDILRIKTGGSDEWLEVISASGSTTYGVIRDKAGDYAANSNPAWKKGTAIVNYKQSGDGGCLMTSSEANAPYMSIFTHAGSPWSATTTRLRIGNLNGYLGYSADKYGIGIGDTDNHLKYDPDSGLLLAFANSSGITLNGGSIELWNSAHTTQYMDISGTGIEIYKGGDVTLQSITGAGIDKRASIIFQSEYTNFNMGASYDGSALMLIPETTRQGVFVVGWDFDDSPSSLKPFETVDIYADHWLLLTSWYNGDDSKAGLKLNSKRVTTLLSEQFYLFAERDDDSMQVVVDGRIGEATYGTRLRLIAEDPDGDTGYVLQSMPDSDPGAGVLSNGQLIFYTSNSGADLYVRGKDHTGNAITGQLI